MKIWKRILPMICVVLMMFALAACGEQSNATTAADEKTTAAATTATGELAPLGERAPGEGREPRGYVLEVGGEIPADYTFSVEIMGKTFTHEDAAKVQIKTANIEVETSVEAHNFSYVGFSLKDVLAYLGVEITGEFIVEASDGYGITFTPEELDDNVMIAITRNGKAGDAPYYAPCTSWVAGDYIRDFALIKAKPAE